jgi:hypothetical protein
VPTTAPVVVQSRQASTDSDAEVGQDDASVYRSSVRRLDVAMQDAGGVRGARRAAQPRSSPARGETAPRHPVGERPALEQRHDQEQLPASSPKS